MEKWGNDDEGGIIIMGWVCAIGRRVTRSIGGSGNSLANRTRCRTRGSLRSSGRLCRSLGSFSGLRRVYFEETEVFVHA